MSLATQIADAIGKVNGLVDLVKGQYNKWDGQVKAKIAELENWKNSLLSQNGGVNLYKNSRFLTLNADGNHPECFSHFYSHGNPVYSMVTPDFSATSGDEKIAADLVKLVGEDNWYNTEFKCLKVVCNGTSDTTDRHWSLNQYVHKGKGPLTRGCYIYAKPSSITNTPMRMRVGDNPSGANSDYISESNKALKIYGQGNSGGEYLGFNINVNIQDVSSDETIEFFIVAPFYVEGYVDGYRTSPIDIDKA